SSIGFSRNLLGKNAVFCTCISVLVVNRVNKKKSFEYHLHFGLYRVSIRRNVIGNLKGGFVSGSCDKITCPSGKHCLLDQNMTPHCVKCTRKCPESNPSRRRVCGADGLTYPSTCHLREKACRSGTAIPLAYKGHCKSSATCKKIRCRDHQVCLTDRDAGGTPRCVTCMHRCRAKHMAGPICASNNSTYGSWCHMMQDACSKGFVLNTKYTGKCLNNNLF
ncbi:PREDICTED: follistatin, partial [Nicrophorus vespilloides]|uniref:Follistatin n=1 Tax=Nicrophorus vespilloides TaxID=110193 RepID=A0ABM1N150_NICVS